MEIVGQERRASADRRQGQERRVENQPVQLDQRSGVDRRASHDRRGPSDQRRDSPPLGLMQRRATPVPLVDDSPPFAVRLKHLAHVDLTENEADRHWRAIARHRRNLVERLGRDAGQEVATLDYFLNVSPRLAQPTVIESAALAAIDSLSGEERAQAISDLVGDRRNRRHRNPRSRQPQSLHHAVMFRHFHCRKHRMSPG